METEGRSEEKAAISRARKQREKTYLWEMSQLNRPTPEDIIERKAVVVFPVCKY